MDLVGKLLSLTEGWREGDVDVSPSPSVDTSALESISDGREAPDTVAGYSLDMDSSINVRWKDGGRSVECSHTGEVWKTKVTDGETTAVVARSSTRRDAVETAIEVMKGSFDATSEGDVEQDGDEEGGNDGAHMSGFEEEVESILDDVDTESIKEVNEAFGD
ncbi:hypothetical protein EGH25_05925 [Haladaptatus sp. F3-133]|uniref:Uncharacterized protein n=1 Tax=Halorutilus salinus TaxID=2487751 RepID=A0A9Q4GHK7_9EURY|nr:hypothetical protein [Halorutilus salinus]MCX2818885.1 hypothetical protein [Halorutilus salinus]